MHSITQWCKKGNEYDVSCNIVAVNNGYVRAKR